MNFFHFDGAEMTLRHLTLFGVNNMSLCSKSRMANRLVGCWMAKVFRYVERLVDA